jgi:dsRNA-specific ribonuclease
MAPPSLPLLPLSWRSRVFGEQTTSQHADDPSGNVETLPDTERLAFIGDAIVHLGITSWLHERYPKHNRSLSVRNSSHLPVS